MGNYVAVSPALLLCAQAEPSYLTDSPYSSELWRQEEHQDEYGRDWKALVLAAVLGYQLMWLLFVRTWLPRLFDWSIREVLRRQE